ncbi:hypothetical protein LIER_38940 [Lithospermum erythrorhizon]|uniref:Reverse transcriptase Ty1/copia-type domain-containing protein n=1 Tax=Lithospermum erythrorhizon TaxID=34254 RepID=A0AAV3Q8L8_LITER
MIKEFEMSMMGELNFFLGLQVKQMKDGIFISQRKFTKELIKKFDIVDGKVISTPMATATKLDKDEQGNCVAQVENAISKRLSKAEYTRIGSWEAPKMLLEVAFFPIGASDPPLEAPKYSLEHFLCASGPQSGVLTPRWKP